MRGLRVASRRFAVEEVLAARVQRHFGAMTRLLAGEHDLRRHGVVVERRSVGRAALDKLAEAG